MLLSCEKIPPKDQSFHIVLFPFPPMSNHPSFSICVSNLMICYHVTHINKASGNFCCNIWSAVNDSISGLEMSFDSFLWSSACTIWNPGECNKRGIAAARVGQALLVEKWYLMCIKTSQWHLSAQRQHLGSELEDSLASHKECSCLKKKSVFSLWESVCLYVASTFATCVWVSAVTHVRPGGMNPVLTPNEFQFKEVIFCVM